MSESRSNRKKSRCRLGVSVLASLAVTFAAPALRADPMRDFLVSCSYGVLAGTMVGAATLAFSDKPGENLNKVARGASLGLYAGILLGAYIVYGVPGGGAEEEIPPEYMKNGGLLLPPAKIASLAPARVEPPRFYVAPVVGDKGLEGAQAQVRVISF